MQLKTHPFFVYDHKDSWHFSTYIMSLGREWQESPFVFIQFCGRVIILSNISIPSIMNLDLLGRGIRWLVAWFPWASKQVGFYLEAVLHPPTVFHASASGPRATGIHYTTILRTSNVSFGGTTTDNKLLSRTCFSLRNVLHGRFALTTPTSLVILLKTSWKNWCVLYWMTFIWRQEMLQKAKWSKLKAYLEFQFQPNQEWDVLFFHYTWELVGEKKIGMISAWALFIYYF